MEAALNLKAVVPSRLISLQGLQAFLSSPYIKGVGNVYAGKLVEKFGFQLLSPDFDFDSLDGSVPGLGRNKIDDMCQSFAGLKFSPDMAVLLYSAGFTDTEVEKIMSHYGAKAAAVLLDDPYDMVENVWKVSFFTADKLGNWMGFADDDPRRLRGALLTAVKFYAEKGNVYATESQTLKTASAMTGVDEEKIKPQLEYLIRDERLVRSHDGIYLPVYYEAEKEAAEKLGALIRRARPIHEDYEIPTADIEGHPLNEEQITALKTVMENPVTVVTGGPGTGKTTTIRGIINLFEGMGRKVILAAPTGRAAKRMSELAGAEAKTLHRLLGYSMGRGYRNKHFKADILVIDEASMLEQVMFRHLLDAIEDNTRIVLVGDTNQLPSIGAGDVLNDLINSGAVPVVRLRENFRQKAGSMIAAAAEGVRVGENPSGNNGRDFLLINERGPAKIRERVLELVVRQIPEQYGVDPKDIQVVSPQQDGPLGAKQLNMDIQERVNPDGPEIKRGMKRFRLGDRVMQISNSSEYNVYNGETGWISWIDPENSRLEVSFYDGKRIVYGKDRLKELNLAYATTVHKLQGSETDYMVMIMTTAHRQMLYRNLLYTGISRAKKLCVLVGEEKAIESALRNESPAVRNSNFKHRLRKRIAG